MVQQAIAKLKTEIENSKSNAYVQAVGMFLVHFIEQHPEHAEKVMADGKTIAKSLDEMRKVAEKKKVGNCVVLAPDEGFAIVLEYFGIKGVANPTSTLICNPTASPPPITTPVNPAPAAVKSDIDFDVKLDDFI